MSQPHKPRRPGPPHNPGVRDLVEGKRRWSSPPKIENLKQGFRGWHERGYLPHRDEPGLTQFVTFRLADSFPESLWGEWQHLWKVEDEQQRRAELEAYLDRGRGECHLRKPEIASIVEDAVRFFQGERYDLRAWVVMPNHVHALFKVDATPMAEILESWKKHTARRRTDCSNGAASFGWRIIGTLSCAMASMNWKPANTSKAIRQRPVWFSIRKRGLGAVRGFAMSLAF